MAPDMPFLTSPMNSDRGVFVIAEAGVNHNGDAARAVEMVAAAADAGADAIKFQTFKTSNVVVETAPKARYQEASGEAGETQREMISKLEIDEDVHRGLMEQAAGLGISFLSSPFDLPSLRFLVEDLSLKTLKVASGEITHLPLLRATGASGVQVILSTGMSTLGDVERALGALAVGRLPDLLQAEAIDGDAMLQAAFCDERSQGYFRANVSLLHCTTEYPAPVEDTGLSMMSVLSAAFGLPVGFSDHTVGIHIAVAAVGCGARIIEKHFTLDRGLPGPDHQASLEPRELAEMIRTIREVESAIGRPPKRVTHSERGNRGVARRGIVASRAVRKGEVFTEGNIACKRPEIGIPASRWFDVLGRVAVRDFLPDESIHLEAE
jgi:N-acetylneuraminate synthase